MARYIKRFGQVSLAAGVGLPVFFHVAPPKRHDIKGKTAVVTGCSEGLGIVIANRLAAEGVSKLVIAARQQEKLQKVAADIERQYPNTTVVPVKTDVTRQEDRANLVKTAGRTDILVNNAGFEKAIYFAKSSKVHADIEQTMALNVNALMHLTADFLPAMVKNKCGHVVNVASVAGLVGFGGYMTTYCASKHAVVGFSAALRAEMRDMDTGVTVHAVCPGLVSDVGMAANVAEDYGADYKSATRFFGDSTPGDVSQAVVRAIQYDEPELIVNSLPIRHILAIHKLFPRTFDFLIRVPGLLSPVVTFWEAQAKKNM